MSVNENKVERVQRSFLAARRVSAERNCAGLRGEARKVCIDEALRTPFGIVDKGGPGLWRYLIP